MLANKPKITEDTPKIIALITVLSGDFEILMALADGIIKSAEISNKPIALKHIPVNMAKSIVNNLCSAITFIFSLCAKSTLIVQSSCLSQFFKSIKMQKTPDKDMIIISFVDTDKISPNKYPVRFEV